jgi:hypothetical protein
MMQVTWIVWGVIAAASAVGIAVLVRTRWLQSRTLEKCVVLSVGIHVVLAAVCAFVGGFSPASWGTHDDGPMTMTVVMCTEPEADTAPADAAAAEESPADVAADAPAAADAPPALVPIAQAEPHDLVPLLHVAADAEPAASEAAAKPAPAEPDRVATAAMPPVPEMYADRGESRRAAAAVERGGSVATEQAVQAALAWLAAAQAADGRWDAARHGAGRARQTGGQHQGSVGARSDHGVTGLALLAFLGAGSTHRTGAHAQQVESGLRFLVSRQRADGSLAGDAEFFAALYCHGMATLALAECTALTSDDSLRPALDRAVRHTLAMQHPTTGGWRYAAGDRGDTSQLGWQVMVLTSARQAGMGGLEPAETRARTFLQSVSSGRAGGLAAYRAGERPSMAMTAEALTCRMFLGMPADHPAAAEALAMIGGSPPDRARPNAYAWYYATLASFHAGGPQWERWNASLQAAILPLQRRDGGSLAGSWDPDPVWGMHGGRVYATALAALTLEVYYRYLPMHRQPGRLALTP